MLTLQTADLEEMADKKDNRSPVTVKIAPANG
jgi:hypothetical protein